MEDFSTFFTENQDYHQNWAASNSEFSDYNSSVEDYFCNPSSCSSTEEESSKKVTKWQKKRAFEMTLPLHIRQKRRLAANARERKRMTSLNQAFEKLREILPNQHRDRPLSKMEALQMAQNYIKELSITLQFQDQFFTQEQY